jgi:membrane-associated phospholipid phosphatase
LPNPRNTIFATSATRRLSLAAGALAGLVVLVAVRVVGIGWERANAWEARIGTTARAYPFVDSPFARALDVVMLVVVPLLAVVVGAQLLARYRRGERRLAIVGLGTMGGAVVTAEILKPALSARHGVLDWFAQGYPSGHTTTAFATSLAWAWTSGGRGTRLGPAVAAAGYTAFVGAGVIVDGWHLPSDVAGALGLAAAWFLGLLALVEPPGSVRLSLRDAFAATILAAAVAAVLVVHAFIPADGDLARSTKEGVAAGAAAGLVAVLAALGIARAGTR